MIVDSLMVNRVRLLWFRKSDELDRNYSALVKKLEEAVLSISARFPKINNCCGVFYDIALGINSFTIALHIELLDVRSEFA